MDPDPRSPSSPSSLLAGPVGPRALGRGDGGLERGHQVRHLLGLLRRGVDHHRLALRLALDQIEHAVAVLVAVLPGLEVRHQGLDQLLGHRQLALAGLDVAVDRDLVERVGRDDLVGEEHGLHRDHPAVRPQGHQVLLGAQHHARDAHPARVLHGVEQKLVGLGRAGVRHEVIGMVVEDRIDLIELDEVLDVDGPGLLGFERVQLVGADRHVAIRGDLVTLDDLLVGHLFAFGVDPLLTDARARLRVDLVEAHGLLRDRAVQLHRDVDQPEADRAAPNRTWHTLKNTRRGPSTLPLVRNLAGRRPGAAP